MDSRELLSEIVKIKGETMRLVCKKLDNEKLHWRYLDGRHDPNHDDGYFIGQMDNSDVYFIITFGVDKLLNVQICQNDVVQEDIEIYHDQLHNILLGLQINEKAEYVVSIATRKYENIKELLAQTEKSF